MAAGAKANIHHRTARRPLGLFDAAAVCIADRPEFEAEAERWGVKVRRRSREDPTILRTEVLVIRVSMDIAEIA